jgi:hypothetical protein
MNDQKEMQYECIEHVEDFYIERMQFLVDNEQFDDSDALFREFVVDSEEPDEWIFINNISDEF